MVKLLLPVLDSQTKRWETGLQSEYRPFLSTEPWWAYLHRIFIFDLFFRSLNTSICNKDNNSFMFEIIFFHFVKNFSRSFKHIELLVCTLESNWQISLLATKQFFGKILYFHRARFFKNNPFCKNFGFENGWFW